MDTVSVSSGQSDVFLARQCAAGDVKALEAIYDRWHRAVFGLLLQMLSDHGHAEDVLQQVFYDFWRNATMYNPDRLALPSWLLRLARRRAIDLLRQQAVRARTAATVAALAPPAQPDPAEEAWIRLRNEAVHRALASIPADERQVLSLCYFGGLSQSEAATALAIPLGTVKTRARRGLERLAHALREATLDEPERMAGRRSRG